MTDTGEVEAAAGSEPARAKHAWPKAAVVIAVVVVTLAAYAWSSRPPSYVGKTESARLVGDSCTWILELYGPVPSAPLHASGGKSWLNRATDNPEAVLESAAAVDRAAGASPSNVSSELEGRVHFTSASAATFTTDRGYVIPLVYRVRPTGSPAPHSCAIFGAI